MALEFSVGIGRDETVEQIAEEAREAEACGFDQLTIVDQQNICRDVYLMMASALQATRTIKIGHGVTVPETRHPSVTACATCTLEEMFPGRVFLGIGAGGNALRSMGKLARPMKEFREYTEFMRTYMTGAECEFQGAKMHNAWIKRPVPIYMAVMGPRSCEMAGEIADGIIIHGGVHPEVVKWRLDLIRRGAEKAGRDYNNIDIWLRCMVVIADSREAARREASAYGSRVTWLTLGDTKGPDADAMRERMRQVIPDYDGLYAEAKRGYEAYNEYEHEQLDSAHSKLVTQRMIDFVHLTGTPADICERIDELQAIGVKNISTTLFTAIDRYAQMRAFSETIMPRYR
jgi:5,10-methylenetetrahydromethanopterin reductase